MLGPRERFRLASRFLALGIAYEGADFSLRVPEYEPFDLPSLAVIGTGKRLGKTAVTGYVARLLADDRDLVVVATGAQSAAIHSDRVSELGEDATLDRLAGAERACEVVRQVWRELEEFNLNPELALESLFVRLRRELGTNLVHES